jgi:hypothetical protein
MAATPVVRLTFFAHARQAGNGHCLASPGIPLVVEMEKWPRYTRETPIVSGGS